MTRKLKHAFLLSILFLSSSLGACGYDLGNSPPNPLEVCIQWFDTPSDMTLPDGDHTKNFNNYGGGAITPITSPGGVTVYFELMTNNKYGYNLTFSSSNAGATATTGKIQHASGPTITYTATIAMHSGFNDEVPTTFSLDLTGGGDSVQFGQFIKPELPNTTTEPHIFRFDFTVPVVTGSITEQMLVAGYYSDAISATVSLP